LPTRSLPSDTEADPIRCEPAFPASPILLPANSTLAAASSSPGQRYTDLKCVGRDGAVESGCALATARA